jgi:hypothetical protein
MSRPGAIRSQTLKVNYRTSHQIRQVADRLLPKVVRDVDGLKEERFGTVSVFNGPDPFVVVHDDAGAESTAVGQWISRAVADGIKPAEVGIFVRTRNQLDRARAAAAGAGQDVLELSERGDDPAGRVSTRQFGQSWPNACSGREKRRSEAFLQLVLEAQKRRGFANRSNKMWKARVAEVRHRTCGG